MSRTLRLSPTEYAQRQKRSREGYVEVEPDTKKRAQHTNAYLFHAAAYCRSLGVSEPVAEHYPLSHRDYRLDLSWPEHKIGLDVNGGNWIQGRHARPAGLRDEYERNNLIVAAGWRVFYCEADLNRIAETIMLIANSCLR
jgi:hypothetical protein